ARGQTSELTSHRHLTSQGCLDCCHRNDCRLAYNMASAGVCCGVHPRNGLQQCCPLGSSCVRCSNSWKCTYSRAISLQQMCSICSSDMPSECYSHRSYHSGGGDVSILGLILPLLFVCCIIGLCMYQRQGYSDDQVVTAQGTPVYGHRGAVYAQGPVYPQPGSPLVVTSHGSISMILLIFRQVVLVALPRVRPEASWGECLWARHLTLAMVAMVVAAMVAAMAVTWACAAAIMVFNILLVAGGFGGGGDAGFQAD
ncbi:MAG: hypothetical protein SGPRY_013611, partial [Prymnesium sp.]